MLKLTANIKFILLFVVSLRRKKKTKANKLIKIYYKITSSFKINSRKIKLKFKYFIKQINDLCLSFLLLHINLHVGV